MRILLAYITQHIPPGDDFMALLPAGLPLMAALLEGEGHEILLANFPRATAKKAMQTVRKFAPDLLGLSVFTHNRFESFELAGLTRTAFPACRIVLGGPHASPLGSEILDHEACVDWVIRGEGEDVILALVRALSKSEARGRPAPTKKSQLAPRASTAEAMAVLEEGEVPARAVLTTAKRITQLDALPFGCQYSGTSVGVDARNQYSLIIGSRGCVHACAFCSSPELWGRKVSFRSAQSILDEIRAAHDRYGITYFHIRDDNFTLQRKRTLEFARLLSQDGPKIRFNCQARVDAVDAEILEKLAEAGLEHIQFGIESGSPTTLARFAKDVTPQAVIKACRAAEAAGVIASVYLIGAVPGETQEDIEATRVLLAEAKPHDAVVSPLAIFPGTELCRQATEDGEMDASLWFRSREPAIFAATGDRPAINRLEELSAIASALTSSPPIRPTDLENLSAMRLLSLGEQCSEHGMTAKAGIVFAAAVKRDPLHPWCLYRLAEWQLENGMQKKAEATARALVQLEPLWEEATVLLKACNPSRTGGPR